MKKKLTKILFLFGAAAFLASLTPSCKTKVKDTDVKTSVETSLRSNPDYATVSVDVKDGVATLNGEVKDDATRTAAENAVKSITGVKSVSNNLTVALAPPPPVEITADDSLTISVRDAVKDNPGVTAEIKGGVITLTGEINRADLSKLMQKLNALNPKRIENKLTIK